MKKLIITILPLLLLYSCNIVNPDEDIPAFIEIDDFSLTTLSQEGGATEKISHVWLFQNGNNLGGFPVPSRIPIYDLNSDVRLRTGVRINGFASNPNVYFPYAPIDISEELTPGEVLSLSPVVKYDEGLSFALLEDFEGGHGFNIDLDDDPQTALVSTDETSAHGNNSGLMELDTMNPLIAVASDFIMTDLPQNGARIYIELDYKNEALLGIGLVGLSNDEEINQVFITLVPKEDWNKIYLDITDFVVNSGFSQYRAYIIAVHTGADDNSTERVFIDNFKVIHF